MSRRAKVTAGVVACALSALVAGCRSDLETPRKEAALDEAYFRCKVQPVLTKSCAAFACHGDAKRFFRVFGRNRLRLQGSEAQRNAPLTDAERRNNFEAARAFVVADDPGKSLLLLKPLDQSAGGYYHGGATLFDQGDVFLSKDDPDYRILIDWVLGAKDDPACVEPGSDM